MNLPPRLRFKLEKLKTAIRSAIAERESPGETAHRVCPQCRALIDRGASVCPFCGAKLGSPRARGGAESSRVLGFILVPSTATSVLVAANVFFYGVAWYLTQSREGAELHPASAWGGMSAEVLVRLGGKFGPYILEGQWWRLVTAMFLHAGLLHIGMNLWCLVDLGAAVESLFSSTKFIVLYLVTGICGFLLSLWWSPFGFSVGASGAILGLIGVLIGASFHHGRLGREYRGQLARWLIYILVIGIFFAVDNAAHIGGLAAGVLLGYFVPEGEPATRASENFWNALAILSVLIIAGSFALMALQMNRPLR